MFQNLSNLARHLAPDLFVIAFGKLSALVLEVEVLDVAQQYFLLAEEQVLFCFFDDGGLQRVLFAEKRDADRNDNAASN
jgi:hypothetical protein